MLKDSSYHFRKSNLPFKKNQRYHFEKLPYYIQGYKYHFIK